jgi:hypothetical protein
MASGFVLVHRLKNRSHERLPFLTDSATSNSSRILSFPKLNVFASPTLIDGPPMLRKTNARMTAALPISPNSLTVRFIASLATEVRDVGGPVISVAALVHDCNSSTEKGPSIASSPRNRM